MLTIFVSAPARIASFSDVLMVSWHEDISLPCVTAGNPKPTIQWKVRYLLSASVLLCVFNVTFICMLLPFVPYQFVEVKK